MAEDNKGKPHVAIMGGGVSGLVSALELLDQGVEVTIFEAGSKLGGHVQTVSNLTENGFTWEAGAELVDSKHEGLMKVIERHGIELIDNRLEKEGGELYHIDGQFLNNDEMAQLYAPLAERIEQDKQQLKDSQGQWTDYAKQLDNMSLEDYLNSHSDGVDPRVTRILKKAYTGQLGLDPDKLSALPFVTLIGTDVSQGFELFGDSDEAYRVKGGSSEIVKALEKAVIEKGGHIQTRHRVSGLATDEAGISLTVEHDGQSETRHFDYTISAMPLTALRRINGVDQLGFDAVTQEAIDNTTYTSLTKIGVETKGKPWEDIDSNGIPLDGTFISDSAFQCAWVNTIGQRGHTASHDENAMVTFYIGGEEGATPMPELIEKAKAEYAAMLGKPVDEVFTGNPPVFSHWGTEGRGCFAAPGPGQSIGLEAFQNQTHPSFSMTGEFVPVVTGDGIQTGYMNNAATSAQMEVSRAVELLQSRGFEIGQAAEQQVTSPTPAVAAQEVPAPTFKQNVEELRGFRGKLEQEFGYGRENAQERIAEGLGARLLAHMVKPVLGEENAISVGQSWANLVHKKQQKEITGGGGPER